MKRAFSFFLAFCALLGILPSVMTLPAAAESYDYEQGKAIVKTLPAVWLIRFAPTDITGAVAIKFDFFIDNAANFNLSALEFGSHRNNDWQEIQFTGTKAWPKLQDGWNSVTLALDDGDPVADVDAKDGSDGEFQYDTFQRIRIFNINSSDPAVCIGFRNIVAVKADGTEIPVGSVSAGGDGEAVIEREAITDLTVQPGSDETALQFNWIAARQPEKVTVEIAPASGDFESTKTVVEGTYSLASISQIVGNDIVGLYGCKVSVTGLRAGTVYQYRVSTGADVSELHTVITQDSDYLQAYILSDIHVIEMASWGKKLQVSVDDWQTTLNQLVERDEASMILSLGDQMQDTSNQNYLDGFSAWKSFPIIFSRPSTGITT